MSLEMLGMLNPQGHVKKRNKRYTLTARKDSDDSASSARLGWGISAMEERARKKSFGRAAARRLCLLCHAAQSFQGVHV